MRKIIITCLFIIGLSWALFNFQGLATQGNYDTLAIDFREDIPAPKIQQTLAELTKRYDLQPQLNSEFSQQDHLYIIRGDRQLLDKLRKSDIAQFTEYIEPNYIYRIPEPSSQNSAAPATTEFSGDTGVYNITIAYVDAKDGDGAIELVVKKEVDRQNWSSRQ